MPNAANRIRQAEAARPAFVALLGAALLFGATETASALTIKTTYAASVNNLANAAEVKSAFQAAASVYEAMFVNPVTINLQVGWGELLGSPVKSIGVAGMTGYGSYSYAQIQSTLRATATSSFDQAAYANFSASNPAGSLNYTLTPALARAMGIAPAISTAIDGYVGFGANYAFDFNRADGISAGTYDFMGVALHEISHVLGRVSGLGGSSPVNALPIDLFRYSAPGTSSFGYTAPAYFSIDAGSTSIAQFNASGTADRTDWVSTAGESYSAYAHAGVINDLTLADKIVMDVLGWNTVAGTTTTAATSTTTTIETTSPTETTTSGGGKKTTGGGGGGSGGKGSTKRTQEAFDGTFALSSNGPTDIPEPASLALLGTALLGLGIASRRRHPLTA